MDGGGRQSARISALLGLGRYADAAAAARTDLTHDPESSTLHLLLARALLGTGDAVSALPHARAAAAIDPDEPDALVVLVGVLAEVGEGVEARNVALRLVRTAPDDWQSHDCYAYALLFGIGGDRILAEAERATAKAVELAPLEPQAHVMFGIVRWRRNDLATAEQAFRHALALDPDDVDAQRNLASLHIRDVELADGAEALTRGLSAHPQDRHMHHEIDRVHERVLGRLMFWSVLAAVTFGGFVLATDFLLRQRAFYGIVMLAAAGAFAVKVLRLLPPTGRWSGLLPWRADARRRWRAWLHSALLALVCVVWFTPARSASAAWVVLTVAFAGLAIWWMIRLLVADSEPTDRTAETSL